VQGQPEIRLANTKIQIIVSGHCEADLFIAI